MLSQSNIPVVEALRSFKSAGVSVAFLVPTSTGLEKAIMDATQPLRGYLREKHIHDFSTHTKAQTTRCNWKQFCFQAVSEINSNVSLPT